MDGLLFDTEKLYQQFWHELAAERGFELDGHFASSICGTGVIQAGEVLRRYFPGCDPAELSNTCKDRVLAWEEQNDILLKPGVREILTGLRNKGFGTAVASSSPMEMIRRNLEKTGLSSLFDCLVSGGEVSRGKPFPDIFLLAARRLGLESPACFVFEDSLAGIRAAHAAGCVPVMIPDLVQPDGEARRISRIYPSLSDAWKAIAGEIYYFGN